MAQHLTFDPHKTKTGDILYTVLTPDSCQNLRPWARVVGLEVMEKKEVIVASGIGRAKRTFVFKLNSMSPLKDNVHVIEVTHRAMLFKTPEGAVNWFKGQLDSALVDALAHDGRQDALDGALYQSVVLE